MYALSIAQGNGGIFHQNWHKLNYLYFIHWGGVRFPTYLGITKTDKHKYKEKCYGKIYNKMCRNTYVVALWANIDNEMQKYTRGYKKLGLINTMELGSLEGKRSRK